MLVKVGRKKRCVDCESWQHIKGKKGKWHSIFSSERGSIKQVNDTCKYWRILYIPQQSSEHKGEV